MLMFQNGLFATFIPEILMIFGYILCLLAPTIHKTNSDKELSPKTLQVSEIEQVNLEKLINYEPIFFCSTTSIIKDIQIICYPEKYAQKNFPEYVFNLINNSLYIHFSRPPPVNLT